MWILYGEQIRYKASVNMLWYNFLFLTCIWLYGMKPGRDQRKWGMSTDPAISECVSLLVLYLGRKRFVLNTQFLSSFQ